MFSDQYLAGFKAARGLEAAAAVSRSNPLGAYDAKYWERHARDGSGITRDTANEICEYLEPLLDPEDYSRVEEMIHECVGEDGAELHDNEYSRRGREGVDPYSHDRRRARDNHDADVERLARDRGRRLGRGDEPPAFNGMPRTGSGPLNGGRFGSQDRRGRAMDAILATGPAMAFDRKLARIDRNRESFFTKFPDARRLKIV
jgi:hypothetical protein